MQLHCVCVCVYIQTPACLLSSALHRGQLVLQQGWRRWRSPLHPPRPRCWSPARSLLCAAPPSWAHCGPTQLTVKRHAPVYLFLVCENSDMWLWWRLVCVCVCDYFNSSTWILSDWFELFLCGFCVSVTLNLQRPTAQKMSLSVSFLTGWHRHFPACSWGSERRVLMALVGGGADPES